MNTSTSTQDQVKQAQARMQAGDFEAANDLLSHILQEDPDHQDALYAAAVCARYLKRHDAA
ncbi:MAG: tetratricopeptide repeat protein, partial [Alphaproteobacteria bacterium]|nr:tetratricopeptide repeat protein [Alphaproteobacteria bacterium]